MATVDDMEELTANGELVMHGVNGEVYSMTTIPLATTSLVAAAKEEILVHLNLQSLHTNLNRASDLLFLAYLGLVGTGELHARISNRQKELADLCGSCIVTMSRLKRESEDVLKKLVVAYKYLLDSEEDRALYTLRRCAESAKTMSSECETLALGYGKLKNDTKEDAEKAIGAWGAQNKKTEELEKLCHEIEATKAKEETMAETHSKRIQEAKSEIAELESKQHKADRDEFVRRIFYIAVVGISVGTSGGHIANLGVAASKITVDALGKVAVTLGTAAVLGKAAVLGNSEQQRILEETATTAANAVVDAKSAEEEAVSKATELQRRLFKRETDKETKKKLLESAEATDKSVAGYQDKVDKAKAASEESATAWSELEEEHKEAQAAAQKAKESSSAATSTSILAAASLAQFREAQQHASRKAAFAKSLVTLIEHKLEMEKNHFDSISQVAALTARLASTLAEKQGKREGPESAQIALQIATWALDNVWTSLLHAKDFWDSMKEFCEKQAIPEVLKQVEEEKDFNADKPEKRMKNYKSSYFVAQAVTYLAKWVALTSVCQTYVEDSTQARERVLGYIRGSPSEEEARKLIGPLEARLKVELLQDGAISSVMIEELEKRKLKVNEEAENMSANPTG